LQQRSFCKKTPKVFSTFGVFLQKIVRKAGNALIDLPEPFGSENFKFQQCFVCRLAVDISIVLPNKTLQAP
jgi:hypothetical protein